MNYELGQANRLGNRASNQDRQAVIETEEGILLILADGMGGLSRGEHAAQTLVEMAEEEYLKAEQPVDDSESLLRRIIYRTHDALMAEPQEGKSAGTTAVLCLIQNGEARWAHVGDSRLYVFRGKRPVFRTRDHSYVETLVQQGIITHEERTRHPRRNQITQCIGCTRQHPQVAVSDGYRLERGDTILLCSDGLWAGLDEKQMATELGRSEALEDVAQAMAEQAERKEYPRADNISLIAFRFVGDGPHCRPIRLSREEAPSPEELESAIDQIQQIIHEYEKEFDQ